MTRSKQTRPTPRGASSTGYELETAPPLFGGLAPVRHRPEPTKAGPRPATGTFRVAGMAPVPTPVARTVTAPSVAIPTAGRPVRLSMAEVPADASPVRLSVREGAD